MPSSRGLGGGFWSRGKLSQDFVQTEHPNGSSRAARPHRRRVATDRGALSSPCHEPVGGWPAHLAGATNPSRPDCVPQWETLAPAAPLHFRHAAGKGSAPTAGSSQAVVIRLTSPASKHPLRLTGRIIECQAPGINCWWQGAELLLPMILLMRANSAAVSPARSRLPSA